MIKNYQLKVTGRVQGVGYRYWAGKQAENMEISGIVRNLSDGSVFIEIEGEESICKAFIEKCYEGPPLAHVKHIALMEGIPQGHTGFNIMR